MTSFMGIDRGGIVGSGWMLGWLGHDELRRVARSVLMLSIISYATLGGTSKADTVTYYYTNQQGTPLATADAAGNVVSTADYRPYGAQVLGSPSQGLGYTGHVNDLDSGLVYMQARYYDPSVARFLSVDPKAAEFGDMSAFVRYAYASANPIRYVDLDGRQSWCTPGTCGAAEYHLVSNEVTYIRENFDMVGEVKGAAGIGLEVNYNLGQGKGEVNLLPVAQGLEASLYFQPKNPYVVPLVDNPSQGKMAMAWGPGIDLAAGIKLGLDIKFNPGGSFELNPKFGVGAGEFQQYAPSINLLEWENMAKEPSNSQ